MEEIFKLLLTFNATFPEYNGARIIITEKNGGYLEYFDARKYRYQVISGTDFNTYKEFKDICLNRE